MSRVLDGVQGWLDPAEAAALYLLAKAAAERTGRVCLVELGSHQGRSALAASIGLRDGGGRGHLFAIDPFSDPAEGDRNLQLLSRNLERAGVSELVEVVRAPSTTAVDRFTDKSVDLLFVDGDHSFEAVCLDILRWTPKLAAGAVVGFNDPFLPGVRRALRHLVLSGSGPYRHPRWVVNSLFFDFLPDRRFTSGDRVARVRARVFLRVFGRYLSGFNDVVSGPDRDRRAGRVATALNRTVVYPLARSLLPWGAERVVDRG
jgi:predicted O-methyltransferase YrrM